MVSDEGDEVERLARVSEGADDRAGTKSSVSAPAAMEDKDIQEICSREFAWSLDNDWVGKDNDVPRVLELEEHGATHEPGKRDDGNDALERAFSEGEGRISVKTELGIRGEDLDVVARDAPRDERVPKGADPVVRL